MTRKSTEGEGGQGPAQVVLQIDDKQASGTGAPSKDVIADLTHSTKPSTTHRARPIIRQSITKTAVIPLDEVDDKKFPGTTRILCGGQIITSGASSWLPLALSLFGLPIFFFTAFCLGEFLQTMANPWAWLLLDQILIAFALSAAFMTAFTDPGILPLYHQNCPDILLGKEIKIKNPDDTEHRVFLKYCSTCEIFRPPRCSHCSYCDNCVEEFDHHCPWLSNCIGRRNYRYFFYFISSTAVCCIYNTVLLSLYLSAIGAHQNLETWEVVSAQPVAICIIIETSLMALSLTAMTLYHCFLLSTDLTTAEQIKKSGGSRRRSCITNWSRIFCGPRPTRNVLWKEYVSKK